MTVSTFIKENRVLVAGLVLPLLLIGTLAFSKTIATHLIAPPQYKVMYFSQGWSQKGQITIKLDSQGKLNAVFNPVANYASATNTQSPTTAIFLYDPLTDTIEEVSITLDKDNKPTSLDKFANLELSNQTISDDGYRFQPENYRNSNLITDIFSYRSRYGGPVLVNKNRIINLPRPEKYYSTFEFLGWVKSGGQK